MSELVLGTAGHIDHGKSALVTALTGTDPDRLAEEKSRGITIELGFARLELPSGRAMGVVDVPGHERFVRQMVAGATGIDVVLLVIAADDGIMPQTREHLAIIDLLGIGRGVVALTKCDLVEPEWIELVTEDVLGLLEGTSLEGSPVVPVSSKTGEGLEILREALDVIADESPGRQAALPLRLPVDRVFTIAGAGTVVTGTMWSGTASKDDPVRLYPSMREGRVRGVQVHGEQVSSAQAGQRVALNIAGLDTDEISRGDIVAAPDTLTVTDRFDGRFTYLGFPGDDKPFETGTRVHVHHGTREVLGRVLLMQPAEEPIPATELARGASALVQIRLEEPLAPRYGDRFIVRSYSPVYTIGGGTVLDVLPPRRTTLSSAERELLDALIAGDVSSAAVLLLGARGVPMSSAEVASALGVQRGAIADELNKAELARLKVAGETRYLTHPALETLVARVESELLAFHDENPKATGISSAALRDRVDRRIGLKDFDALVAEAVGIGKAAISGGAVRHPEAAVAAIEAEEQALSAVRELLERQGLTPGSPAELAEETGCDRAIVGKALTRLVADGAVVRVAGDLHFPRESMDRARSALVEHLREHGQATPAELRDLLGVTRKYAIPLLEHFDAHGVTRREGDVRVLREA